MKADFNIITTGPRSIDSTGSSSSKSSSSTKESSSPKEVLYKEMVDEANEIARSEPFLAGFLESTITHPKNSSFESVVARTISTRLVQSCGSNPAMCIDALTDMFVDTMKSDELEHGHTMINAIRMDMLAYVKRDPACESALEVLLYFKGFASLVCHRAAKRLWKKKLMQDAPKLGSDPSFSRHVSLWLQSQASAAFGLDIHPAAEIGAGIMFDHGTGVVIGETATVGDNCTFLHGVTLGGTGKDSGDRHPKVADNVLIGAGSSILGNIKIGRGSKIGAGSIVLKHIPQGVTAVGAPAKIIGFAKESKPGSSVDVSLDSIVRIGGLDYGTDRTAPYEVSESSQEGLVRTKKDGRFAPFFFGRKPKHQLSKFDATSPTSVFRSFRCRKGLPKGAISYECLHEILSCHCSEDEIGEIFLSMLKMDPEHGYIPAKIFSKEFPSVAQKFSQLDIEQCKAITKKM